MPPIPPTYPHNDPDGLITQHAAASRGSLPAAPENMASGPSRPSAFRSSAHSPNFTGQRFVAGVSEPIRVLGSTPPIHVRTVAPWHNHLTPPSYPVGFFEAQPPMAPQFATHNFAVPQQQYLSFESLHRPSWHFPPQRLYGSTSWGSAAYPPSSMDRIRVDGAPDNFSGQPTWSPRPPPMPPIHVVSVAPQNTSPAFPSNGPGFVPRQSALATQPASPALTPSQQQSLTCDPSVQSSSQYLPQQQQHSSGMFNQAQNCVVTGPFIDGNVTYNNASSTEFMKELLKETIPGAASDSSARDPPPRCHPGTRLAILKRCLDFIRNCDNAEKIRWVFGAAGVGKSAIMQSVAESPDLQVDYHASVFFSINGRNDGAKAILTISYQFAAKSEQYRQAIEREITHDPSLLRSSMATQFIKLIVEPFIHDPHLKSIGRVLIIIDGLDECSNPHTQLELLRLISDFCATYPSSPLVWNIASRPEPHITSFFSRPEVVPVYEKEEIQVDANEARADVERFLRHELNEIRKGSSSLDPRWPEEQDFWKVASAAGGLFAYATTVVRYISDWRIGNPASLFSDVLHVIDKHSMIDLSGDEHPLALLDALYARILSNVPRKIMINTRKLLLALASDWDYALDGTGNFVVLCNWLGMTADEAYAALHHLRSVLDVPQRDMALWVKLEPFHKSFIDYVSDSMRSGFSPDIQDEARQLMAQCAARTLKEAPNGVFVPEHSSFRFGRLARTLPIGDSKVSLSWSVEDASGWNDVKMKLSVYQLAIGEVIRQITCGDSIFESRFCVCVITARFAEYSRDFPFAEVRDWVFDKLRRSDFMLSSILHQTSLKAVQLSAIMENGPVKLRFRGSVANAWRSSCKHEQISKRAEGKVQDWMTTFIPSDCTFCYNRFKRQLGKPKGHSSAHKVIVLATSAKTHCMEIRYVDPGDGVSVWTYWFWFKSK